MKYQDGGMKRVTVVERKEGKRPLIPCLFIDEYVIAEGNKGIWIQVSIL